MTIAGTLERLRARIPARAGGFLAWWGDTLAGSLPLRWRKQLGLTRDRLLLQVEGDHLQLQWQDTQGCRALAQLPLPLNEAELERLLDPKLTALPRWLVLPAGVALRRPLRLPAAAAERLRDVVRFELDRQTPFTAETACFDAWLRQRRTDGQLEVDLVAVPRPWVDDSRKTLGELADSLAGIDVMDGDGAPMGVNLLPAAERRIRHMPMRGWRYAMVAMTVLALITAGWQILENRRQAADAFEAQMRGKAAQARQVATQRQQLQDLVEGMTALDQARASRPTAVEVMDELSQRLPDNTYLEKMSIEGERLLVIGLSSEASGLVARMQDSRLWRSPALSGALQPDPATRRDRFTLTAELVGTSTIAGATVGGADAGLRN